MAQKFGERIRQIREKAGCSQKEFCALLDIPQSTLSAYETDRMQPTIATLIKIAQRFNLSLDYICGIEPNVLSVEEKLEKLKESVRSASEELENLKEEIRSVEEKQENAFIPTNTKIEETE